MFHVSSATKDSVKVGSENMEEEEQELAGGML